MKSDERFRLLVESVEDYAIFMLEPDGRIASWNRGAQAIKGYSESEVLGKHFSLFYRAEDVVADKPGQELVAAQRDGRAHDEGWRVRKDGSLFWAYVVITALHDASGKLRGFAKVTRDLSELRSSQEELRQSEERFRRLVDSVPDHAMYVLDADGIVRSWNAGAQKLKGFRAGEVIGRHFRMFFPPADAEARKPERELDIALVDGEYREQGFRVRKDGSQFWAEVRLTPMRDNVGQLLGFSKITHDLTSRLEAEAVSLQLAREQLARSAAQAAESKLREAAEAAERAAATEREANRMKDVFLATVTHELRTPLQAIVGWASLLRARSGDAITADKAVEVIQRNALAQQRIIDDLLDVSRMTAGTMRLDIAPVSLSAVVREALEVVATAAAAKKIRLDYAPPAQDVVMSGDAGRLRQVIWNLLSNAVKFSDAGGSVLVDLHATDDECEISVVDHGRGIPPEFLPFVFERFRQADSAIVRQHGGLGLGLAIVRQLVELHGGRISAHSGGEGRGATFSVVLPRSSNESTLADPGRLASKQVLQGFRVLVIDDDRDAADLVRAILAGVGAVVETANSAQDGAAAQRAFRADVVVSDIGMPDEDGYRLLALVRDLPAEEGGLVPVIALTAYPRATEHPRLVAAGFTRHIGKPFEPDALITAVREVSARPA